MTSVEAAYDQRPWYEAGQGEFKTEAGGRLEAKSFQAKDGTIFWSIGIMAGLKKSEVNAQVVAEALSLLTTSEKRASVETMITQGNYGPRGFIVRLENRSAQ